jgi:hypothetical protein
MWPGEARAKSAAHTTHGHVLNEQLPPSTVTPTHPIRSSRAGACYLHVCSKRTRMFSTDMLLLTRKHYILSERSSCRMLFRHSILHHDIEGKNGTITSQYHKSISSSLCSSSFPSCHEVGLVLMVFFVHHSCPLKKSQVQSLRSECLIYKI